MRFDIMTLFPEMVMNGLETSIIGRAVKNKILEIEAWNIRSIPDRRSGTTGRFHQSFYPVIMPM